MRYSGPGVKGPAVNDLFGKTTLIVAAIFFILDAGFAQTLNCTTVRMDPEEVTIPAEGGLLEATLTTSPAGSDPDDPCDSTCLFSFSRPGFTLSGCSGDSRCRLVWEFPFRPSGKPNECTTRLTNPIPPNTGPPRMGTLYSFSGDQASLRDKTIALDALVIRQDGVGGGADDRNSSLSPIYARDDAVVAYRDTTLSYRVLGNDAATADLDPTSIQIKQQASNGVAVPDGTGRVSFAPAQGFFGDDTFTYTVMDAGGKESNTASVLVTVKNEAPFTGCVFARPNRHLHLHHPALYLPVVQQVFRNPPVNIVVHALRDAVSVEPGVEVRVQSSKPIFPGDSGLPELTMASSQTQADGAATFEINPPKPNPSDRIDLTAIATIDGKDYSCQAALLVGLGTQLAPFIDALDEIADTVSDQ